MNVKYLLLIIFFLSIKGEIIPQPIDINNYSSFYNSPNIRYDQTHLRKNIPLTNFTRTFFETNNGQAPSEVKFIARSSRYIIYFENDKIKFFLPDKSNGGRNREVVIKLNNSSVYKIEGLEASAKINNYFLGNHHDRWSSNNLSFKKIKYVNLYKNIDVIFYFTENNLEFDFEIAPGGSYQNIKLGIEGHDLLRISENGSVVIKFNNEAIKLSDPIIFQTENFSKIKIEGGYKIDGSNIGFKINKFDPSLRLTIDPIVSFSTFYCGSGTDIITKMFIDNDGFIYITGETNSPNFPVTNAIQQIRGGGWSDCFIAKLNKNATEIIFSTFFGGSNTESAYDIKVDNSGFIYIVGNTSSTDFPVKNAFQKENAGGIMGDVFILKLSPSGDEIIFSTYFGGSDSEQAEGIVLDKNENIIIAGGTSSKNLPIKNAFQSTIGGGYFPRDAFVSKFTKNCTALIFSTYLGGSSTSGDQARDIAIDNNDNIYITGYTTASDFPVVNAYQSEFAGGFFNGDAFISKFNPNGVPIFSTFFGGTNEDEGKSIVVDENQNIYLTGTTHSADFPIKNEIWGRTGLFDADVFISKFKASGNELFFSTYLGGSDTDEGMDLTFDKEKNIYVTGYTGSPNFVSINGAFPYNAGSYPPYKEDAFITKIKNDGSEFEFSSFFGGSRDDIGNSIALDNSGNMYLAGYTKSRNDFPIKNALYSSPGGSITDSLPDAFITKFTAGELSPPLNLKASVNGNEVNLSWDLPALGNFLSFNIYRSPESPVTVSDDNLIYNTDDNNFSDNIIMTGKFYHYVVTAVYNDGESLPSNEITINVTGLIYDESLPKEFTLYQNFPNPFNGSTKIIFAVPENAYVKLKILNILGELIQVLVDENKPAGFYEIRIDLERLNSGVYFYRLESSKYTQTKKLLLLK